MSRFHSYLHTATVIINHYRGEMPFTLYLKNFFKSEKKYGSRDRKSISSLCYNYYRAANALNKKNLEEKVIYGHFLCSQSSSEILQSLRPELNDIVALPIEEKLIIASAESGIFPFNKELSASIDFDSFNNSFLVQPAVFIRIRPGHTKSVLSKLKASGVLYNRINNQVISFESGVKIDSIIKLNTEAVIQDLNSQRVGELLQLSNIKANSSVWDCCAASGGKSIMAYDLFTGIQLTVSDIRETIIYNLHKRFLEAGIKSYSSFVTDIADNNSLSKTIANKPFDLVICDAPCSGSGTWSRTPEQLLFFNKEEISRYSNLQKRIVRNASSFVKQDGYFLYITCSVFKKENEDVVDFILKESGLNLVKAELYKGYSDKADTMFGALFRNR